MKRMLAFFLTIIFLNLILSLGAAQEEKKDRESEKNTVKQQARSRTYRSVGRRDPFRSLLSGQEIKEKTLAREISEIPVDDIVLIGIVKVKSKFTAFINVGKGFPCSLKVGDRLADGFVKSITDFHVVFRKTKERGIVLLKPKNIIKEIFPERQKK